MSEKSRPTNSNSLKEHRSYGIRNWLTTKLAVMHTSLQDEYICKYCDDRGFIYPETGDPMTNMEAFVSKRFPSFATWSIKYKVAKSFPPDDTLSASTDDRTEDDTTSIKNPK